MAVQLSPFTSMELWKYRSMVGLRTRILHMGAGPKGGTHICETLLAYPVDLQKIIKVGKSP